MRILTLHNRYQLRGGEDESVDSELALMLERGHTVLPWFEDNASFDYSDRWRVGREAIWSQASCRKVRELIRSFRPDLVKIHNFFPLLSPSVVHAAAAEGIPVVLALHNFRLLCPGGGFFRSGGVCQQCLHWPLPFPAARHGCYRGSRMATTAVAAMTTLHRAVRTWDRVSLFVTPSEFARGTFEKAGFSRGRIRVKPNFLARDPLPGAGSQGYAVFAGRLAQEKGLRTLLQAWRLLRRPMPLKIVGDGPLHKELAAMASGQSMIELLGMQPAEAVYALMGEASFVIVPSEWPEVFGRVVIEAFAKGAPVVASAIGALPELIEHGRTGLLFRPGDPEDLAANIDWLLTHPAEASRMRREARAEFLAKYTADRNYQMLMEIYESVLAGKPSEAQPVARAAHAAGHAD